jgi:acetolactate synthase regulatory subunit
MNEWDLIWRLGLALLLSASIGLDRSCGRKAPGGGPTRRRADLRPPRLGPRPDHATTLGYFVVVYVLAPLARMLPASPYAPSAVRVVYADGRGILRKVLEACTSRDFKVADVNVERGEDPGEHVAVSLEVHGSGSIAALAADLGEIDGVHAVAAGDVNEIFDA